MTNGIFAKLGFGGICTPRQESIWLAMCASRGQSNAWRSRRRVSGSKTTTLRPLAPASPSEPLYCSLRDRASPTVSDGPSR